MKPLHKLISGEELAKYFRECRELSEQRAYDEGYHEGHYEGYYRGQKELAKLIMETFKEYEVPMLLWEALKEY
jgi:flagellar biosynthesis/type III secretory pathway protein FliH